MRELLLVGLGVMLAAACGSDHSTSGADANGGMCTGLAACGGDITGEWKITGICFDTPIVPSDISDQCPTAKLQVSNQVVTGNVSYKTDMTFSQNANITATVTLTLPGSCLQGVDSTSCSEIEASSNTDPTQPQVTCTQTSDGGCQCSSPLIDMSQVDGTFTTSGDTVMMASSDGSSDNEDYCVKSKTLYLLAPQMEMGMAGTVTGTLLLAKE
jgi:hypothetical protein